MGFLEILGFISLIGILVRVFYWVWKFVLSSHIAILLGFNIKFKELGQWAVITGSTDGIGKAYAEEFARHGMDVVLLSRTPAKLQLVADSITSQFNVKTKSIAVDFNKGLEIYETIRDQLNGLDIGVLVNNVGMCYDPPGPFLEVENGDQFTSNLINCNMLSCSMMCRIVMPQMISNKKGLVINISSITAMDAFPYLAVYSASKAFVDYLTEGLQMEYRGSGVIIQSVMPAFVSTNMTKNHQPSFFLPTAKDFVKEQLTSVGIVGRTAGCFAHNIQVAFLTFLLSLSKPVARLLIEKKMQDVRSLAKHLSNKESQFLDNKVE